MAVVAAAAAGHWLLPVHRGQQVGLHRHPRHKSARQALPADALAWTPAEVVQWIDALSLSLHG